jgi:hypothetical protein
MKQEEIDILLSIGYSGNFSLSDIIDWIRINKGFNIWVEHGFTRKDKVKKFKFMTHDITTSLGCHRGSYDKYEDAQLEGIKIFIRNKCTIEI